MSRIAARYRAISPAVIALVAVFFLLSTATASAGTYDVTSCNADGSAAGWYPYGSGSATQYNMGCPTRGDLNGRGLTVVNAPNVGVLGHDGGGLRFSAPAGTSLVGLAANVRVQRSDSSYWVGLMAGSATLAGWWANEGPTGYAEASFPSTGWFDLAHQGEVHLEVGCSGVCDTSTSPPNGYRARAQLFDPVTIRIEDTGAPAETLTGGALITSTYATGSQPVNYSASDASGIRVTRLYVDGTKQDDDTRTCDFEQPVPCTNVAAGSYSVDTRGLSDGPHVVKVETVDSAGNSSSQSRTINVDNSAPGAPVVGVAGGENWRGSNDFRVSWTNANGETAPVVKARYQLCRVDQPADCEPAGVQSGANISSLSGIGLPGEGDYALTVWLEDAAGNTSVDSSSAPVHLRYDATAPGQVHNVSVVGGEAWRSKNSFDLTWNSPESQPAPIAAVHYRLCDAQNVCTSRSQTDAAHLADVELPGVGEYSLAVWLEDAAGNASDASASAPVHLRFDDTDPGLAQPSKRIGWLNAADVSAGYEGPVALAIGNAPPPSGIAGYAVTTDGSDPGTTPTIGTDGLLHIAELPEGTVTVRARAISNSGVASSEIGSATLSVDKTAPTAKISDAPSPDGWERGSVHLTLSAKDELSGMGGGHVAYSVDGGADEAVSGDSAQVEVGGDGLHEVRYYAVDAAGNRADAKVLTFRIDGQKPGAASPESSAGWITQPGPYEQRIALAAGQVLPSSGLAGFSVTLDGSTPDETPETGPDGKLPLSALAEGVTTVRARAISGSGVASDAVGTGTIRVDRTAPVVVIDRPDHAALTAEISDATSGVSSGSLEVRAVGATEWKVLSRDLRDGKLTGAVLPSGPSQTTYDVRATAVDAAGNQRVVTSFANGDQATVTVGGEAGSSPAPIAPIASSPVPAVAAPPQQVRHPAPVRCAVHEKRPKRGHRRRHRHVSRGRAARACKPAHPRGGEKHRHHHLGRKTHKPARKNAG